MSSLRLDVITPVHMDFISVKFSGLLFAELGCLGQLIFGKNKPKFIPFFHP